MTLFALIFILAAIGISETTYLIRKRIALEKPFCPMGGGCEIVLSSKYNHIFIIPNDIAGLITYIIIFLSAGMLYMGVGSAFWLMRVIQILILASLVMSLILTYLQWRVIKAWCFWCLMSAITIGFMGIILLIATKF